MLFIHAGNRLRSKIPVSDSTHAAQLRAYSGYSCRCTGSLCLHWCGHINKAHVAFLHRWSKIIVHPKVLLYVPLFKMPSCEQDCYNYDRWHVFVAVGIFIDKNKAPFWSGSRTHERGVWIRCYNQLSYSFIAVGAFWVPCLRHLMCAVKRNPSICTRRHFDFYMPGISPSFGLTRSQVLLNWANVGSKS